MHTDSRSLWPWLAFGAWLALVATALMTRPLTPIDETRYVSVAWEMWLRGDFLVPYINGEPYSHKPPLLFWLMQLSWALAGVNDWTPRLVAPLFGLANLFLAAGLARGLWPEWPAARALVPPVLLGAMLWTVFTTTSMFDMLVAFFTLVGLHGLLRVARGERIAGWALVGLAVGGGVLAKGPVILVYLLPPALLAPWWARQRPRLGGWLAGLLGAVALGAAIALAWAIPAALSGGEDYARAIFWGQTAGRMVESFAHQRPWWWYLPLLPLLLFPWSVWGGLWRGLRRLRLDPGVRLCLAWSLPVLVIFSLISGKQVHYLLPVFPAFALLAARAVVPLAPELPRRLQWPPGLVLVALGAAAAAAPLLAEHFGWPAWLAGVSPLWGLVLVGLGAGLCLWRPRRVETAVWGLSLASVGALVLVHLSFVRAGAAAYDLRPLAARIAELQAEGVPVAQIGKYHAQYQFLGRLRAPIAVLTEAEMPAWVAGHPEGRVLIYYSAKAAPSEAGALYVQDYRGDRVALWAGSALLVHPDLLHDAQQ